MLSKKDAQTILFLTIICGLGIVALISGVTVSQLIYINDIEKELPSAVLNENPWECTASTINKYYTTYDFNCNVDNDDDNSIPLCMNFQNASSGTYVCRSNNIQQNRCVNKVCVTNNVTNTFYQEFCENVKGSYWFVDTTNYWNNITNPNAECLCADLNTTDICVMTVNIKPVFVVTVTNPTHHYTIMSSDNIYDDIYDCYDNDTTLYIENIKGGYFSCQFNIIDELHDTYVGLIIGSVLIALIVALVIILCVINYKKNYNYETIA